MKNLLKQHRNNRKLTTLVENRSTYSSAYAELNIFETHQASEQVVLKFQTPIIASMLTGKKIAKANQATAEKSHKVNTLENTIENLKTT